MAARVKSAYRLRMNAFNDLVFGVDPGEVSGVAVVARGELTGVAAVSRSQRVHPAWMMRFDQREQRVHIVWEKPEVYKGKRSSRPDSLIVTAFRAGRIVSQLEDFFPQAVAIPVLPKTWKGQVPKPIHNKRVWDALSPDEQALVQQAKFTKTELDDVLDAVGLAKWYHKRLG